MSGESKRILVVDDDVDIVNIIVRMLHGGDYQVEVAYGGEEALAKVRSQRPDLVLLDIMMPQLNGMEVLKAIRELDPTIRTIMITAYGDIDSYLDAMEWGALEYINKPFDGDELLRMIGKVSATA
jgi:DNA-binding NtrC family response regulator